MAETHIFTKREEVANAVTHGIGTLLSIAALTLLIVYSSLYGTAWHVVTFTIYGVSMLLLYVSSTMVHSFPPGKAKDVFEILDHAAIYVFIAGTYTPIALILIEGALGWTMFGIVWGLAIGGTIFKIFFVKKFLFISTLIYLAMGWLAMIAIVPIFNALSTTGLWYLVIGGLFYSIGTIFYMWRGFRYHHAVWHLFVIAGSVFHFFLILHHVLPVGV
ncbi:hemolysin III family protein [Shouchella sp. JSM 1781072]|uniref:PAQR family membrane homeostasis protein TrhA n=1 Tax=Bacillaceae TaxID=186817 RepID=UPI000C07AA85|nr:MULTISPECIES: hemolysin III family protein [Bacillaceae]UTR05015.1 hemolysin III family protein [Alkalihalobacillus sp. LMS6]